MPQADLEVAIIIKPGRRTSPVKGRREREAATVADLAPAWPVFLLEVPWPYQTHIQFTFNEE